MAAVLQSRQVKNNNAPLTADGAEPVILTGTLTLTAALVVNDLLEMVILPAGYVPVDVVVATEDLDSNGAPAVVLKAGVMAGTPRDTTLGNRTTGAEIFTGKTIGQTGGVQRADVADIFLLAPSTSDRSLGIQVTTAPATSSTTAKIRMIVTARPQLHGE